MKGRIAVYLILFVAVALIWRVASAPAHRLSGRPATLRGKLELAQRQVAHDRASGAHHWLGRDRTYARQILRMLRAAVLPAHYAGWSCITNGAYPGAAHEGNGYNGRYSGPLGMTTPWLGHYPPGSDWVHSSVTAVYWIAEREAARARFAYSFMKGQWPNTYPPCAGRF